MTTSTETLSDEIIIKIKEFSSKHSDGVEDADMLKSMLVELLLKIVSYCRSETIFKGYRKTDKVEIWVILAVEGLSVCVKTQDGELRECFKREIPLKEIEKLFLRLLGFCESI